MKPGFFSNPVFKRTLRDICAKSLRFLNRVRATLFVGVFSAVAGGLIVAFVTHELQMSVQQEQINTIMRNSLKKSQNACDRYITRLGNPRPIGPVSYIYEFGNLSALFHTMAFQAVYIDYLDQIVDALDSLTVLESEYFSGMKNVGTIEKEAKAHCAILDDIKAQYF